MAIYKTISPVHVGTGIEAPGIEYYVQGDTLSRYLFEDIVGALPPKVMVDTQLLNDLARNAGKKPNVKEGIYRKLQSYANFGRLDSIYTCAVNVEYPNEILYKNVLEQVKDLNRPYIPGSTLKGAVSNAFRYAFLKKNYGKIKQALPAFLSKLGKNPVHEGFILNLLGQHHDSQNDEFFRELSSCLRCPDIFFSNLEVYEGCRMRRKGNPCIPLPYVETISASQSASGEEPFILDHDKLKRMKDKATSKELMILECFNETFLAEACNLYTADMLESDLTENMEQYYDDCRNYDLFEFCHNLRKRILNDRSDHIYLRVGKYTNYFFKTISWLIKVNSPELYYKFFQNVFSPVGRFNNGAAPDPKVMPSTRTIFRNLDEAWLLGFIEITQ